MNQKNTSALIRLNGIPWFLPPPPVTTPLLYLAGTEDGCMGIGMCRGQAALHGGRYQERHYPGAGHFLHLERPAEVAADIISWLGAAEPH